MTTEEAKDIDPEDVVQRSPEDEQQDVISFQLLMDWRGERARSGTVKVTVPLACDPEYDLWGMVGREVGMRMSNLIVLNDDYPEEWDEDFARAELERKLEDDEYVTLDDLHFDPGHVDVSLAGHNSHLKAVEAELIRKMYERHGSLIAARHDLEFARLVVPDALEGSGVDVEETNGTIGVDGRFTYQDDTVVWGRGRKGDDGLLILYAIDEN